MYDIGNGAIRDTNMENRIYNSSSRPAVYYQQSRSDMLRYIPRDVKRTLEMGCACGNFSEQIKTRFGAECWGIEINQEAGKAAAAKLDKVIIADAGRCLDDIPDNYFDCIICNDFLEHLADPYSLLVGLKDKFTDSGILVASFPNIRYWRILFELVIYGNWDYKDWGILDRTHLRFFTYKSLQKMFPKLGYELLTIESLPPNPTFTSRVVKFVNILLLNKFEDTRYDHFACVARPI